MSKGLSGYYQLQIDQYNVKIHDKNENLKRLEAQRNDLNARGMFHQHVFISLCTNNLTTTFDRNQPQIPSCCHLPIASILAAVGFFRTIDIGHHTSQCSVA